MQRHDQKLDGERFEWNHKGALGSLKADWSAGFDYSRNTQTRFPMSLPGTVSVVAPSGFATENFFDVPGMRAGFAPDRTNKVNTLALFLENRLRLTPALALVTGLRHDRIGIEVINHKAASASNPAYFQHDYTPTTGRAGLVYDVTPHANVYVQYSTAADPPAGILSSVSYGQARNSELTTGRQFELGSKFDYLDGRGSATLALYSLSRKNLAIADQNNPGGTLPVGQQSSKGVELASSFKLSQRWLLQGNIAYTDAQYDSFVENVGGVAVSRAGKTPANIPAWVANLWLSWNPSPALQLSADARHVSGRYGNTANTVGDAAYSVFGASLSYQLRRDSKLTVRVKNLADKVYAANVGSSSFYLGAPRSLDLTLQSWF